MTSDDAGATGALRDPLTAAAERVGDRWSLLVVDALLGGPRRFNELQGQVEGIAPNILSRRLKHLEREGIVLATPYQRRPVRHAYALTAAGQDLADALRLLAAWAARDGGQTVPAPHHDACGSALEARWYCPTCARSVGHAETPGTFRA